jgi:hypothetical protein
MSKMTPEAIEIAQEMRRICQSLEDASKVMYKDAEEKANNEMVYRKALSQEIMRLRAEEKMPANLAGDVARGNVAELKFLRDLSTDKFKADIQLLEARKVQASVLQSIFKRYEGS